jgi:hypothetical protein
VLFAFRGKNIFKKVPLKLAQLQKASYLCIIKVTNPMPKIIQEFPLNPSFKLPHTIGTTDTPTTTEDIKMPLGTVILGVQMVDNVNYRSPVLIALVDANQKATETRRFKAFNAGEGVGDDHRYIGSLFRNGYAQAGNSFHVFEII